MTAISRELSRLMISPLAALSRWIERLMPSWHPTRYWVVRRAVEGWLAVFRSEQLATQHGFRLWVPKAHVSPVVTSLALDGEYERATTRLLSRVLQPGDSAVDVGANIGYTTCLMASLVGRDGRVDSFEPYPESFDILKRNVELNRFGCAVLNEIALSDRVGTADLSLSSSNPGDHSMVPLAGRSRLTVATETFDRYYQRHLVGRRIGLLKLDIQGHELSALRGMRAVLEGGLVERVLFELWPHRLTRGGQRLQAVELLERSGFAVRVVASSGKRYTVGDIVREFDALAADPDVSFDLLAER